MFDKFGFLHYIKETFPGCVDNHWNYDLVENIVEYGLKNKNYSKNQLAYFLTDLIPEIEFEEVQQFYNYC